MDPSHLGESRWRIAACAVRDPRNKKTQRRFDHHGGVGTRECQRGVVDYAASKDGLLSLARALALDQADDRSGVNSVGAGSIRTPTLEKSVAHFSPDLPVDTVLKRFGAAEPLGRVGTVEEVAELAAFLLIRSFFVLHRR